MDAFAVSLTIGMRAERLGWRGALLAGGYFGGFQAAMPLLGYLTGRLFAGLIVSVDHWVAFALLAFIGGRMVLESLRKKQEPQEPPAQKASAETPPARYVSYGGAPSAPSVLSPAKMLPLAVATSIDALAIGVTFSFLRVDILPAVGIIGFTTLSLSALGAALGRRFGARFGSGAGLAGGLILILMGVKILVEHLY